MATGARTVFELGSSKASRHEAVGGCYSSTYNEVLIKNLIEQYLEKLAIVEQKQVEQDLAITAMEEAIAATINGILSKLNALIEAIETEIKYYTTEPYLSWYPALVANYKTSDAALNVMADHPLMAYNTNINNTSIPAAANQNTNAVNQVKTINTNADNIIFGLGAYDKIQNQTINTKDSSVPFAERQQRMIKIMEMIPVWTYLMGTYPDLLHLQMRKKWWWYPLNGCPWDLQKAGRELWPVQKYGNRVLHELEEYTTFAFELGPAYVGGAIVREAFLTKLYYKHGRPAAVKFLLNCLKASQDSSCNGAVAGVPRCPSGLHQAGQCGDGQECRAKRKAGRLVQASGQQCQHYRNNRGSGYGN
jgi:hypothetical protein